MFKEYDPTGKNKAVGYIVLNYNDKLKETICHSNIDNAVPYINAEGKLCICAPYYEIKETKDVYINGYLNENISYCLVNLMDNSYV